MRRLGLPAFGGAVAALGYRLIVRGDLTLDTGIGRRVRPLGPIVVSMAAPQEVVFDVIAAPYLGRTPLAMAAEITVLERGSDMVLAAHHTAVGDKLVATTVETVRFSRPDRVSFRLLRGPVPHVVEEFALHETDGVTRLEYTGELGTDFWALGAAWGALVSKTWESTVRSSLERIGAEAERRGTRRM